MLNPYLETRMFEFPLRPLLIEVDPNVGLYRLQGVLTSMGIALRPAIPTFNMIGLLPVPAKLIEVINALPGVTAVHADLQSNALVEMPFAPNHELWHTTSESRNVLEAGEAFKAGWTGETVRLFVIDTGIDPMHPQLEGAEWESAISIPREAGLDVGPTSSGHGSHVASTAAGKLHFADVGFFVEGVSRARIHSIQALGRVIGTGFTSEIVDAMGRALEKGAKVVNMSLGSKECQGGCDACPQCRAVRRLTENGVLVAIAAGNSGPDANTIGCPGCSPYAITVGAIDREGQVASFSSRGGPKFPTKPDVVAPGVDIFSGTGRATQVDGGDPQAGFGYAAISGTSMATPHVAGFLALLAHRNPEFTTDQFKQTVRAGGAFNPSTGWGVPKWSMF
ncbi:hypothetical protein LCGC14_2042530 [marine sediment metagenome]|uniref:Peptidase S8/S53 domain-containing protein n=1 Tax=marine sediment metagenome TaxID=412755 RepID=A0A0F9ERA3_9ZZZZ